MQDIQSPMGRRVRIATYHGSAGEGKPLLGTNDVANTLSDVVHTIQLNTEVRTILSSVSI